MEEMRKGRLRRDNTARRRPEENKPARQIAGYQKKWPILKGPDLAMDVGWGLLEEFTSSGSFETLARTTTDRVRLGGTTTGRFLAACDDHTHEVSTT
jgi:hypothetical protein